MKRDFVALLIHPYKNALVSSQKLRESIGACAKVISSCATEYPQIKWNLCLPGYLLELIDPIELATLRELNKKGSLEWVAKGYTEPFLSFSPKWLTGENLKFGIEVFAEYTGVRPVGFVVPFSNWEPSHISTLRENGFQYVVVGRNIFSERYNHQCGYWVTEHLGVPIFIIPSDIIHFSKEPLNFTEWICGRFAADCQNSDSFRILVINYLIPLTSNESPIAFEGLRKLTESLSRESSEIQTVRLEDYLSANPPCGFQFLESRIVFSHELLQISPDFLNYLYTFDQVGLLQRKLMDICADLSVRNDTKLYEKCKKTLFFVSDINHYLPGRMSGFTDFKDRLWCYGKMIEIENVIFQKYGVRGGQIRVIDFLRNGNKSILMTNSELNAYIDHNHGAHIFELDYKPRNVNLFAGYCSLTHQPPKIILPGKSKTSFVDHVFLPVVSYEDFVNGTVKEQGDFVSGKFEYKIKKVGAGVRTVFSKQGVIFQEDKLCPLAMEKVLGLEKDKGVLSFVYQLSNHSLTTYLFKFAIELTLTLPGINSQSVFIYSGKGADSKRNCCDNACFDSITDWEIIDPLSAIKVKFSTQKPVDLWMVSSHHQYQGTTFVLSSFIRLEGSASWKLMGKMICRKLRKRSDEANEI